MGVGGHLALKPVGEVSCRTDGPELYQYMRSIVYGMYVIRGWGVADYLNQWGHLKKLASLFGPSEKKNSVIPRWLENRRGGTALASGRAADDNAGRKAA